METDAQQSDLDRLDGITRELLGLVLSCNKWREDQERRVLPSGSRNSQGPRHQPSNICRTPCKALFKSESHKRCPRLELRQTCITHTIIRTQNVNIHATRTSRRTLNEAYMDKLEEKNHHHFSRRTFPAEVARWPDDRTLDR